MRHLLQVRHLPREGQGARTPAAAGAPAFWAGASARPATEGRTARTVSDSATHPPNFREREGNKWSSKFGTPAFPPISPTVFVWICSQQASKPADWKEESLPSLPLPKMGSKSQGDDFWIPSPLLPPIYLLYAAKKRGAGRIGILRQFVFRGKRGKG